MTNTTVWDARVFTRLWDLEKEFPQSTKIRLSTQNEGGRWVTLPEQTPVREGIPHRLQVFAGAHVLHSEKFFLENMEHAKTAVPQNANEDLPRPHEVLTAPEIDALTAPLDLPPAIDPLQVLSDRISADNERIQELHRVILQLVTSVSTHAAGATGPLVKLIDQLTGNVTENNKTLTDSVHRRLKELDARENVVVQAEAEAEERLADADEAQSKAEQEGAVLSGILQHLGPELLSQFTGLGGNNDVPPSA